MGIIVEVPKGDTQFVGIIVGTSPKRVVFWHSDIHSQNIFSTWNSGVHHLNTFLGPESHSPSKNSLN